ncbi:hypothetical protein GYMLUDRAFT_244075 [Collybiopsis luxurians FD-317 M1]|uniref:BRCT domain-containing protein n=1 Tax=Collybiopsis luxurians FD-317 M1 TaxID=944289 RepID=A0A0D0BYN0_9AGAR|nr:hypothetical protein GYMLUDRAFT_244075 [Collybiopsis luxurians FD-317 M1]
MRSVGPSCTHIVYTLGQQKTVEQYFALNEEFRLRVVGAAWLKHCNDRATHLDEEQYRVDLDEFRLSFDSSMSIHKTENGQSRHKRRKLYILKFCSDEDGALIDDNDDDMLPLIRARLRKRSASSKQPRLSTKQGGGQYK